MRPLAVDGQSPPRRPAAARSAGRAGVLLLLLLAAACGPSPKDFHAGALPERVDFNFHVKPILSDRCFACHGPDAGARRGDLRLDLEDEARRVIRAGSPGRSELFARIASADPGEVMPPRDSHLSLSGYEIALIGRWIEQGAEWKPHWSFLPPQRTEPPAVRDPRWSRNPIDRWVHARLEREGLRPAPEADRERLIRRVSYDLTGLPPTVEEVDAFLSDRAPGAYERVVDRLLASPAYGERMATEWLDLARYADSHGYQDDGIRHMWRWREWVIGAFNRNQPYDQFVTWQIAGDLLPGATREQVLATGFNRNHPQSAEGGIVDEEYRVEYVADRTNTFGRAFLGLTTECARCHDHKYDPISQKDYYRLFAFFNNNNEVGISPIDGNPGPTLLLPTPEEEARLAEVRGEMRRRDADVRRHAAAVAARAAALPPPGDLGADLRRGLIAHYPLDQFDDRGTPNLADPARPALRDRDPVAVPGRVGKAIVVRDGGTFRIGDAYEFERTDPFTLSAWIQPTRRAPYASILGKEESGNWSHRGYELALEEDRLTASLIHHWPTDAIQIRTRAPIPLNRWTHVAMTYDGSSAARGLAIYLDGRRAETVAEADHLDRTILVDRVPFAIGRKYGSTDPSAFEEGLIDEVRVHDRALSPLEVAALAGGDPQRELAARPTDPTLRAALVAHHLAVRDPEHARLRAAAREARVRENEILSAAEDVMVMQELPRPRPAFLLERGAYDARGDRVEPGTPASVLAFPADLPPNRLGLARWLTSPAHPLTARVAANRYWQMLFGTGLVRTSDDFGNQGELPSHPELLDWLAVRYRESGWDTKAMLRLMVTSATYRQASHATPALRERDPDNRLLARGPSYRLPAEMVRDGALAASGLLVRTVGGPSVKPYQPAGLWEEKSAGRGALATYQQDHGDGLYRRTLYTFWKRSSPPPMHVTFDAADRDVSTVRRQRTNTPLQALNLLNDPQYVEAARVLAERMAGTSEAPDAAIRFGFRAVTSRTPSDRELRVLRALYERERAEYAGDRGAATSLLSAGEAPRAARGDPATLAAYTVVANTLLNLDEAVTKR